MIMMISPKDTEFFFTKNATTTNWTVKWWVFSYLKKGPVNEVVSEKPATQLTWAWKRKSPTFHYSGWLIGIFIMD